MTSETDIDISLGQAIMGKKKYGTTALIDTMRK